MRRLPRLVHTALFAVLALAAAAGCDDGDAGPRCSPPSDEYCVPLAGDSPWPKFRRNEAQNGASTAVPDTEGGALWTFDTGMGIFSSPVIGGDGTVYIGSADRTFYAIEPDGTLRWSFDTGEIIDSSALLDDLGRVYFGSGDGFLYALDADSGDEVWRFEADDPAVNSAFIRWFEGNVAIGLDGTLYAPNDNFFIYAIDRDTGEAVWRFHVADQTWSLAAVDASTGTLYTGNNNLVSLLGDNIFAIGPDGREVWSTSVDGSVAASPLLTPGGTVVVGGFDGFVRAYDAATGDEIWSFGTRDHIYASPGLLPDGTIVQPSADGTVYCLDPATGDQIWAFDTREPLRSSPAIDAEGNVYLGSGEGRLFVINASGTLRWAMSLIEDDRNDLNSSPALGFGSVVVAGESGQVFSVPLDYCLRDEAADDARCTVGPDEDLPDEGAFLYFTSALGGTMIDPPDAIEANQVLAFSLFVRESGDTTLALIDSDSVNLAIEPATDATIRVSGDRRFITVVPVEPFTADAEGNVTITITGRYLIDLDRDGLAFSGGVAGGNLDETFTFALAETAAADIPLPVPTEPGEASGVWEVYRLAAPLPTILPSYNQIGFDQLRYLVGLVEGTGEHAVGWFVGGRLVEGEDRTVVDPGTLVMVPFEIVFRDGLLTLSNQDGMSLNVMNADLAFDSFLVSAHVDETGTCTAAPQVHVETNCQEIELYGAFLERLGFCNPSTHLLTAFGTALIRPWAESPVEGDPDGLGEVELSVGDGTVVATLTGSTLPAAEHLFGILLIDAATGRPVTLDYPFTTERGTNADGTISSVTLTFPPAAVPDEVRAYLMIDTYPAARATLSL